MSRHRFLIPTTAFVFSLGLSAWLGCKPSETAQNETPPSTQPVENNTQSGQAADGQQAGGPRVAQIDASTPEASIKTFLEAVRLGDAETASSMLTSKAYSEMQNAEMHVLPPGSPHAQYQINNVSFEPQHGGAFVDCQWSDIADDGSNERRSYDITWILRQENNAWKVAGMSTALFPNQPPLVLNFEDPADMQAQVEQANAEMIRQAGGEGEILQATAPGENGQPGLR